MHTCAEMMDQRRGKCLLTFNLLDFFIEVSVQHLKMGWNGFHAFQVLKLATPTLSVSFLNDVRPYFFSSYFPSLPSSSCFPPYLHFFAHTDSLCYLPQLSPKPWNRNHKPTAVTKRAVWKHTVTAVQVQHIIFRASHMKLPYCEFIIKSKQHSDSPTLHT